VKISPTDLILNKDGSVYHLHLLPEDISNTIITVGDPERVHKVSKYFDGIEFEMNKREFITHTGRIGGKRITVMSTGIGTDNVEIFFNEIDALVNIDLKTRELNERKRKLKVIRIGTSGALQKDIKLDSHLVSDYAVGLDNLMNFYNLPMNEVESKISNEIQLKTGLPIAPYVVRGSSELFETIGKGMIIGNTVTCPGFYAPQGRSLRLPAKFPELLEDLNYFHSDDFRLTNFEMETAGYYALGRLLGHDVLSVNAILANRITNKFSKNPDKVIDSLIKTVLERI
jgi:uridine phosphorylase